MSRGGAWKKKLSAGGRLDTFAERTTHVNLHVLSKDIKNAQKFTARMINTKGYGGAIVSGVAGVVLGTAVTASRGIVGAIYKGVKTIGNEIGKMASGIIDDHTKNFSAKNIEHEKNIDLNTGRGERTFNERLKNATEGKTPFTVEVEKLSEKKDSDKVDEKDEGRTFADRLKEASGDKETEKGNEKGAESPEEHNGKAEKEAAKEEERSRDD